MTTKDGILFEGSHSCDLMSFFSLPEIHDRKTTQSPKIETSAQNQQKGRKSKILQEWKEMEVEIKLVKTVMFAGIAASKPVIAEQWRIFWLFIFILMQQQLDGTRTMPYTSTAHPEEMTFDQPSQNLHIDGCESHPWMSICHWWEGKADPRILQRGATSATFKTQFHGHFDSSQEQMG